MFRPIAGVVNLCPRLANEQDIDYIALLISHELTHALVRMGAHACLCGVYVDVIVYEC